MAWLRQLDAERQGRTDGHVGRREVEVNVQAEASGEKSVVDERVG
jgi:hypothetical protein